MKTHNTLVVVNMSKVFKFKSTIRKAEGHPSEQEPLKWSYL